MGIDTADFKVKEDDDEIIIELFVNLEAQQIQMEFKELNVYNTIITKLI